MDVVLRAEQNLDATVYISGLDEEVSINLLWEHFAQFGRIVSVKLPRNRSTGRHNGYGFVEFVGQEDANSAAELMNMVEFHGKTIRVNRASAYRKNRDVGANIFIGNLDPEVDEKLLYETFGAFGVILQEGVRVMRDPRTCKSKGFAFVNFASFRAADAAIDAMDGKLFIRNKAVRVSYAFKKGFSNVRHGSATERLRSTGYPLRVGKGQDPLSRPWWVAPPRTMAPPPPPLLKE